MVIVVAAAAPGGLAHVGEHQVLEADLRDRPGGVQHRAGGAHQQRGLHVGVAGRDDLQAVRQRGRVSAWAEQQVVGGQQLVYRPGDAHPRADKHDQVVADPFQVRDQVRGQHHGQLLLGDGLHQVLQELPAGQRVQAGHRLVQDQQLGTLGDGQGQRELGALPAGQGAGLLAGIQVQLLDPAARQPGVPVRVEVCAEIQVIGDRQPGSKVSVVEMLPGLLPGADRDLVLPLHKRVSNIFEAIMLNTTVSSVKEEANGIRVSFDGPEVKEKEKVFDKVLVSVGRKPNSEIPGLEKTKVKAGPRGFIQVNKQLQTDDPVIYAIGDVVGEPMLAHKASHEGRTAAEAIAGHKVAFEPHAIPAVVFTDPEIAWCGLTETQAEKDGREIKVARFPWAASGRAMTIDRTEGMTKLIFDPKTERVLGVGIVGVSAGEMISEGVLALEMAATATDVELTIHPHPTLSETIMESAEMFFGTSTDVYRPKR